MEKRIHNIVFINTFDGKRLTYNVLFTHHCDENNKDYAIFVNEDDDENIILLSYDENITFKEVTDEKEIEMMTELLHQFDEQMCDIIYENDELMLSKLNKYMYEDIHLNSLDDDNRKFVPDEVFETLEQAKNTVDFLIDSYDNGYHIAKQFTNNGYATKALKLFLKCLKEKTNAKELYGITLKENIASQKVLQKCGFKKVFEGVGLYQNEPREIVKTIIDLSSNNNTVDIE